MTFLLPSERTEPTWKSCHRLAFSFPDPWQDSWEEVTLKSTYIDCVYPVLSDDADTVGRNQQQLTVCAAGS